MKPSRHRWPLPMTPGQSPPGDPSYLTPQCRVHANGTPPTYHGHPNQKSSRSHIPAWGPKHPTEEDMKMIRDSVDEGRKKFCPFLIKECVEPNKLYRLWMRNKKIAEGGRWQRQFFSQEQYDQLPSIKPGSLGTCAFVSLADTIMTEPAFGRAIDAHDTVLRLGHPPIKGFERYVGQRVDIVVGRGATLASTLPKGYEHVAWTLGTKFIGTNATALQAWGVNRDGSPSNLASLMGNLYRSMVPPLSNKMRGSTSGIKAAMWVAFSGFCERLDIFGMSPYNGGHYFCNKGRKHTFKKFYTTSSCGKLQFVHSPGLENWLLHHIMKHHPELNVCVYL
eukprot:CAMPEP_0177611356 /NCGR_PEP_ID=MMETSP0419_2-20121207/20443_1 /TAXON_ID=582737 /ORGANISM="Tetraselmis sp., Strain GSL018" /LENGTH=334 /DNA_ID=CAMNT_0019107071 /DNA_START=727 /DNA_END=1731 /DNA_ORIENTATION=-